MADPTETTKGMFSKHLDDLTEASQILTRNPGRAIKSIETKIVMTDGATMAWKETAPVKKKVMSEVRGGPLDGQRRLIDDPEG